MCVPIASRAITERPLTGWERPFVHLGLAVGAEQAKITTESFAVRDGWTT